MKKKLIFALIIGAGLIYFTSCKDDDNSGSDLEVPFSENQDVEADKAKLEDNLQLAVAELDNFKDEQGIEAVNSFADIVSSADPISSKKKSASDNMVLSTVKSLRASLVQPDPRNILLSLKSVSFEPQSIKEVWDSIKGIYTWNLTTKSWDYTTDATKVQFKFPSKKDGTSNNADFTISSYKGVIVSSPIPDYTGDLPTEVKASLKVDNVEYFAFNFNASYNTNGIPTSVNISVAFRNFVFAFDFINTTSDISVNYKFTNGSKIIFDIGSAVKGNFSRDNIENAENVEEVLYNANAHFQLFNVKIAGMMDVVKIRQAEDNIYPDDYTPNFDYINADSLMAIEINKNAKLIAFFTDTKQKIADVKAYMTRKNYSYSYWDYVQNKQVTVTEVDSYIDFRLVFADGSPASAENYFGEGFANLVTDINNLLVELNTKFGSNFEPITYNN